MFYKIRTIWSLSACLSHHPQATRTENRLAYIIPLHPAETVTYSNSSLEMPDTGIFCHKKLFGLALLRPSNRPFSTCEHHLESLPVPYHYCVGSYSFYPALSWIFHRYICLSALTAAVISTLLKVSASHHCKCTRAVYRNTTPATPAPKIQPAGQCGTLTV